MTTLLKLAQERGLEAQSTSLATFREKLVMKKPAANLDEALALFTLFQKVLDRPEVLEQVAFEALEDCYREGTRMVELRFSPGFVCEFNELSWQDALDSFHKGITRGLIKYADMKAGLICIASRNLGAESVARTIEFFLNNQSSFIGLDLAGNEGDFPCRLFQPQFKMAIQSNAKITIHAGEGAGPENIWEAIELLGARRIGHGVSSIKDPKLMEFLNKNSICLEMCPTSNWLTSAVAEFKEHPLPLLLRAGVPVSINTDDPAVFGVTLPDEIRLCREKLGMSESEIDQCMGHAKKASFLS